MTSLKGVALSTVDVSLTKAVYQNIEAKDFEQAHAVACLGVTQVNKNGGSVLDKLLPSLSFSHAHNWFWAHTKLNTDVKCVYS